MHQSMLPPLCDAGQQRVHLGAADAPNIWDGGRQHVHTEMALLWQGWSRARPVTECGPEARVPRCDEERWKLWYVSSNHRIGFPNRAGWWQRKRGQGADCWQVSATLCARWAVNRDR